MLSTIPERRFDVADVLSFSHDGVIRRYCRDYGKEEELARACFAATLQFLSVCALHRGKKVPSREIDEMWHTMILFTRDYARFCEERLGRFVHHLPTSGLPADAYPRTRAWAVEAFGELDERFWPVERAADCDSSAESCCP